jgi:hypothetical protein
MAYTPLEENDYKILKFINEFSRVSKDEIIKNFNGKIDGIEYRINLLETPDFSNVSSLRIPIDNSSYIENEFETYEDDSFTKSRRTNFYYITDFGKRALQDHIHSSKKETRLIWIKNCWIPMLVSLVTTLTTIGLTQLIPMMLSRILK